jgi:hypothetical protein
MAIAESFGEKPRNDTKVTLVEDIHHAAESSFVATDK